MLDSSNRINDASHASLHKVTTCSHPVSDINTPSPSSGGNSKQDSTILDSTATNLKSEEQLSLFQTAFSKVKGIFTKGIGLAQNFWNTPSSSEISILQANNVAIQKEISNQKNNDKIGNSNELAIEVELGSLGSDTNFQSKEELRVILEVEKEKNRKFHSIEEESIQIEQPIKWEASGTNHLLDSYNKEGEYSSLLENSTEQGYDSNLIKSNFNKTR